MGYKITYLSAEANGTAKLEYHNFGQNKRKNGPRNFEFYE